jgi:uncharacterized membrane protein YoaK (UPF0700 family)
MSTRSELAASAIHHADVWLALGLAFVGGYGDAASFVLAKTFTGHVTGNLVLMAIGIAARDARASFGDLIAIAAFLLGIWLSVLIARPLNRWTSWPLLPTVMGIEVILIVTASLTLASPVATRVEIFVICMSLALGLQNGAFRRAGGISVHTTYLTGMITSFVTTKAGNLASPAVPHLATPQEPKIGLLLSIWAAFVLGAGVGAAMVFHFKVFGLIGAALVLMVLLPFNSRAPQMASTS